ncbi:CCA tRNA nucleotidyltransferase [Palleronia pelagia]|uniref:Poly(A) polymerase n=1 Tax=Palleronia pelagia TaxID=387096 RepID=A0A1H8EWV1_9RHOB|nr:CCA tRNA nucleotidyltransferase [Palleronia pelagia]SEN23963.1 poly(A) polymerase [Palleronia pelagia]
MKITGAQWLADDGTQRVLATLTGAGHQALAVGGCVRNQLIGAPVDDVDIATDAVPERVIALAEAAGLKPVPTGIDHGTVTVVVEGEGYEVTTFRKDVDTDGRHATVAFSDRIEEDAARRDFTMNALYADATGTVLDPLGGLPDLHARRVRFIGDAEQRIREDYLRILRYFRFHAWYGDPEHGVDAEALAACAALAEGLEQLSAERVGAETLKLLSAPDPAPAVASMAQSGILARILPGADPGLLAVLVHLEGTLEAAPDPLSRLAVLGGDEASERLRLSRKQAARLALLRDGIGAEAGTAELAWRHGADTARDVELLRAASFSAPLPADLGDRIARGATARFPVRGADLAGDYKGPEIGRKLAELERRWIASGMTASRDDLLG